MNKKTSPKTPEQLAKQIHRQTKGVTRRHYKKKKSQINITKPKTAKQQTHLDWKYKYKFYNQKRIPDACIDDLAEYLIEWAEDKTPKLFFEEFLRKFKIRRQSFKDYLERSEKLRDAKEYAIQILSVIRERKAYKENYFSTFRHTQGLYSPDWKSQETYFNELKTNVAQSTGTKYVVMDPAEKTAEVPEKK